MGRWPQPFWALLLLAAALRFLYVLAYPQVPTCSDCARYDEVGRNVAAGVGFVGGFAVAGYDATAVGDPKTPEIGIGPVYPIFVGLLYRLFGDHADVVRTAQAALSALLLIPLFAIARWAFDTPTAVIATALTAVCPALIVYSGMLLTETLAMALLVSSVWAVLWAGRAPSARRWALAGVIAGASILLRGEFLPVAAVMAVIVWWRQPGRRTVGLLALYVAAIGLTMAPWVVRNYRVFHRVIPVAAHDGDTLWISAKGWTEWHMDDPELRALVAGRTYLEQEDAFHDAAVREILGHPTRVAWIRLKRFPDFWLSGHSGYVVGLTGSFGDYWARGAFVRVAVKASLLALNTAFVVGALVGLALAIGRREGIGGDALLLAAPIVCIAAVHLALFAAPRYQVPIMPFTLTFAAWLCRTRLLPATHA